MTLFAIDRAKPQAVGAAKIRGVQLAVVVDNKDGTDNPGFRVKLKFPWLSDQETTFWARIAVPMAGNGRGTYVLPEIEDQVLVVFEHGDVSRPIVVGALWSRKQEPVEVNDSGKNNTKLIRSRCGHRIIFNDKDGAERITIVDSTKQNKIVLDSVHKLVKIECEGDIEVKAKANVILHGNALKVGAKDGITGKGQSVLSHAQNTLGLKAASGITIGGGSTTANVSNAAATRVSGSGSGELGAPGAEAPRPPLEDHATRAGGARSSPPPPGPAAPAAAPAPAPEAPPQPRLVLARWSTDTAGPDDEVQLQIYTEDHPPGTAMKLVIKTRDGDERIQTIDAAVTGSVTSVPWKYHQDSHGGQDPPSRPTDRLPDYYYDATVAGDTRTSGILAIRTTVSIVITDKTDRPVRFARYTAKLVGGRTVEGETDDSGIALLEDVPPGSMHIKLLDHKGIEFDT